MAKAFDIGHFLLIVIINGVVDVLNQFYLPVLLSFSLHLTEKCHHRFHPSPIFECFFLPFSTDQQRTGFRVASDHFQL